jgi:flagellin
MALIINTNTSSMIATQAIDKSSNQLSRSSQQLSTGKRINSAKDGAADIGIISVMNKNIDGNTVGSKNARDASAVLAIMDHEIMHTQEMLTRMRTLAVTASNGAYSSTQLSQLDTEFQQLITEVTRHAATTTFNGISLLTNASSISMHVGASTGSSDSISFNTYAVAATDLSIDSLDITSSSLASTAISTIDTAIDTLTTDLAEVGAYQAVFESASRQGLVLADGLKSARSNIEDTDYAQVAADLAKAQVLQKVGIAMLVIANGQSNNVLDLLRG